MLVEGLLGVLVISWKTVSEHFSVKHSVLVTACNVFVVKVGTKILAGHLTGAALNPANATGRALVNGDLSEVWIFWVGPLCGFSMGVLVRGYLRKLIGSRTRC